MKKSFLILIIISTFISFATNAFANIEVKNLQARPSMGKLGNSAAYMDISNNSEEIDILLSAETNIAENCEIHKTVVSNNIHQMIKIDKLAIPSKGSVLLAPHNIHIMLIGLKTELKEGDEFTLNLIFEKAGKIEIKGKISKIEGEF
ncbi:MAG: copper chaperone PCu(A)C [Alphaproteobacteria bacterium]